MRYLRRHKVEEINSALNSKKLSLESQMAAIEEDDAAFKALKSIMMNGTKDTRQNKQYK